MRGAEAAVGKIGQRFIDGGKKLRGGLGDKGAWTGLGSPYDIYFPGVVIGVLEFPLYAAG